MAPGNWRDPASLLLPGIYLRLCRDRGDWEECDAPRAVPTAIPLKAKKGPSPPMEFLLLLLAIVLSIALSLGLGAGLLTLLLRLIQTHSS